MGLSDPSIIQNSTQENTDVNLGETSFPFSSSSRKLPVASRVGFEVGETGVK